VGSIKCRATGEWLFDILVDVIIVYKVGRKIGDWSLKESGDGEMTHTIRKCVAATKSLIYLIESMC
jgi:hypothetical protein